MSDYDTRHQIRRAVYELAKQSGDQMVTRQSVRGEPAFGTTQAPEPRAAIRTAKALTQEARRYCLDAIRYAREDGLTWQDIGDALGIQVTAVDPDDHGAGESVAGYAYEYAVPGYRGISPDWFTWTCPSCGENIRDYGPGSGTPDAEQGHAEGCERFAEAVRAWDAQWEDDNG